MKLHFKWVARLWTAGAEDYARFVVCDDEDAARKAIDAWQTDMGREADAYQLMSPDGCPHCERPAPCHCWNDE